MCKGSEESLCSSSRGFSIRQRGPGYHRVIFPEGLVQRHHTGVSAGCRAAEAADGATRTADNDTGT